MKQDNLTRLKWPPDFSFHQRFTRLVLMVGLSLSVAWPLYGDSLTLHEASRDGDIESVRKLLNEGFSVNARDDYGNTPLRWASLGGHTETAKMLIEQGADLNARGRGGRTPLHWVSLRGHAETAEMLVELGADLNARDDDGDTPFDVGNRQIQALLALLQTDMNKFQLHAASGKGDIESVQRWLNEGFGVNDRDDDDRTPLHWASYRGHTEIVKMLVEQGADINAKSDNGMPLHWALYGEQTETAKMLVEQGAALDARDHDGNTPLHLASSAGQTETAKMFVEQGAALNARDHDGNTPLHLASSEAQTETAKMLVEQGAALHARDHHGNTPLQGHKETAKMLAEQVCSGRDFTCRLMREVVLTSKMGNKDAIYRKYAMSFDYIWRQEYATLAYTDQPDRPFWHSGMMSEEVQYFLEPSFSRNRDAGHEFFSLTGRGGGSQVYEDTATLLAGKDSWEPVRHDYHDELINFVVTVHDKIIRDRVDEGLWAT